MFEISIKGHMASAHFLRCYEGPCKNLHGHTWHVEAVVAGETLNDIGLLVDFRDLKKRLNTLLDSLDHICFNDLEHFKKVNPSTENIAQYIYREFKPQAAPLTLKHVRVWESDTASVTYYES